MTEGARPKPHILYLLDLAKLPRKGPFVASRCGLTIDELESLMSEGLLVRVDRSRADYTPAGLQLAERLRAAGGEKLAEEGFFSWLVMQALLTSPRSLEEVAAHSHENHDLLGTYHALMRLHRLGLVGFRHSGRGQNKQAFWFLMQPGMDLLVFLIQNSAP